ncbi:T9SS type A sorting domain-containing protein [Sediminibacter sp. Hel_I_10]|uniref:T9SS type A sorting domain-containing protein n=1 Tax=Sediminibacter sp. Hel_I_10 TaxID=1392490 RepID=UPI0004791464|nr:T9SS type A sorting domain-containing protein [Sediminibacter sp. Hel_I_10]
MKNFTKFLLPVLCGAATLIGTNANAFQNDQEGCSPSEVVMFNQGMQSNGNAVAGARSDASQALGTPDMSNAAGGFVSLGIDGSITLSFTDAVLNGPGDDLMIYETSFSGDTCGASDDESAMIEVYNSISGWVDAGTICRDGSVDIILPYATQIRITDVTTNGGDGYDVDGIVALNGCVLDSSETDGCFAMEVVAFEQGLDKNGNPVAADRSDATKSLNEPDRSNAVGGFVTLGFYGTITLQLSGAVVNGEGADIKIWETTFAGDSCTDVNQETALIELSDGLTWVEAGTVCRDGMIDIEGLGLPFVTYIRITDLGTSPNDGYDVDGIEALYGCTQPEEETNECYGAFAINYLPGTNSAGEPFMVEERMDTDKALGAPQIDETLNFLSLGYGGEVTIVFDGAVYNADGADIEVVETTYGNQSFESYPESADIYVSQNGVDFYLIGSVQTDEADDLDISNAPVALAFITQVKVVDTTPEGSVSGDGFDLDGIVALTGCSTPEDPAPAGCYAADFFNYVEGTTKNGGVIDAIRTETPENVLGMPEGTDDYVFTTLGYGGEITLTFDGAVLNQAGPDLFFVETSFNKPLGCETYPEYADVYVSADNFTYNYAGTVCKSNATIDISDAGDYDYINYVKVVNNNDMTTTPDGYDLDGVIALATCAEFDMATFFANQQAALTANQLEANDLGFVSYPNPTTGISNVEFVAKTSGKVLIEVYDINGRNIAQVFNGETFAGQQYKADFNGSNLSSGLYIYKITTNNTSITEKFIISK